MPPNDRWTHRRERLVRELAAQAGPVLRKVRLAEELRASRQRLVEFRVVDDGAGFDPDEGGHAPDCEGWRSLSRRPAGPPR